MKSMTSRLVVATVALVAVVALAIGAATAIAMSSYLTGRLDHEVTDALDRATPHQLPGGLPGDGPMPIGDPRGQSVGTLTAVIPADGSAEPAGQVVTYVGEGRTRNEGLSSEALAVLGDVPTDGHVHEVHVSGYGDYRVAAVDLGGLTVVSGLPSSQVDDVVNSLIWWEILLSLLGIAAAAGAALLVVRRQLAPLRDVAATAHEVAALPLSSGEVDLSARVADPDERTEVGQVGAALNTLLAHVESSLAARHRSEQQVRQFVADASHELRTPLSTIRGYAELATRTPDDPAALGGSLAKVSAEADRMSALVEDLLLLARLDAGRPLDREPVDLTHLLLEAVADARVLGPEHHWRLDLPDEPVEVPGDEQRLHQVVTNLVANAIRHTPPGTTVTLSATRSADEVVLEVADDGPGFPDGTVEQAFERFTRADTARTRGGGPGLGGVGLGLSIVKAIADAHGGGVRLISRPGDTRIIVTLPRTALE